MSTFEGQEPRSSAVAADGGTEDVEQLEHEVARTRAELGDTVEALSAKLDVRTRASRQVEAGRDKAKHAAVRARESVTDQHGRPLPAVWIGAGTALTAAIALAVFLRTRR